MTVTVLAGRAAPALDTRTHVITPIRINASEARGYRCTAPASQDFFASCARRSGTEQHPAAQSSGDRPSQRDVTLTSHCPFSQWRELCGVPDTLLFASETVAWDSQASTTERSQLHTRFG